MRSLNVNLVAAVVAYFTYYLWPQGWGRAWAYYVSQGMFVMWLAIGPRPDLKTMQGLLSLVFTMFEAGQQTVCGAIGFGAKTTSGQDICKVYLPEDFYRSVAALALSALATLWITTRRKS